MILLHMRWCKELRVFDLPYHATCTWIPLFPMPTPWILCPLAYPNPPYPVSSLIRSSFVVSNTSLSPFQCLQQSNEWIPGSSPEIESSMGWAWQWVWRCLWRKNSNAVCHSMLPNYWKWSIQTFSNLASTNWILLLTADYRRSISHMGNTMKQNDNWMQTQWFKKVNFWLWLL